MHPDLAEGTRESWASASGTAMSLESHSRGWKPNLNIVCLEIIDESIGKRKKHLNYEHFSCGESSVLRTALKYRHCERSEPRRAPRPQQHGTLHKPLLR